MGVSIRSEHETVQVSELTQLRRYIKRIGSFKCTEMVEEIRYNVYNRVRDKVQNSLIWIRIIEMKLNMSPLLNSVDMPKRSPGSKIIFSIENVETAVKVFFVLLKYVTRYHDKSSPKEM